MTIWLRNIWLALRQLSGDDAYERYLEHLARCNAAHPEHVHAASLSRAEFFKQHLKNKWDRVNRCC